MLQSIEPVFNFSSIILVEPMMSAGGPEPIHALRLRLIKDAYERRDVWSNREDAYRTLKARRRAEKWDSRVLELYVVSPMSDLILFLAII